MEMCRSSKILQYLVIIFLSIVSSNEFAPDNGTLTTAIVHNGSLSAEKDLYLYSSKIILSTYYTPSPQLSTTTGLSLKGIPSLSNTTKDIFIVILSLLVIFALLGNFTLLTTIITVRKLHSKTHMLLVDLAVSDIILAVTVVPIDINVLVKDGFYHNERTCEFFSTMFFMSLPASSLSLCLLTLERYITLKYPLTRLKILSKKEQ
eukprot:gene2433-2798_t